MDSKNEARKRWLAKSAENRRHNQRPCEKELRLFSEYAQTLVETAKLLKEWKPEEFHHD